MPALWSATDASLILLKRSDTFKTVYPSKMSEAMAMRCPVILGVEGEAKEVLEAAGAGVAINPESAEELAAAMRKLADQPELAAAYGRAGARVRRPEPRSRQGRRALPVVPARGRLAPTDQRDRGAGLAERALAPIAPAQLARPRGTKLRLRAPHSAAPRVAPRRVEARARLAGPYGRAVVDDAAAAHGEEPAAAVVCASPRHDRGRGFPLPRPLASHGETR